MTEDILAGTLEHEALRDEAIHAIVKQLRQNRRNSSACQKRQPRPTQEGATTITKHAQKVQAMDWQMQKQVYIPLSCLSHYSQDTVRKDGNISYASC
jgi:hypothetical protein